MTENGTVTSIPFLDLGRYVGLWHEIGRLPLKWEDAEATDITAHYSLDTDGSVKVDNRCYDAEGKPTQSVGKALPVEGETSQLEVTFLPSVLQWLPFTKGDYWVLKIDDDYQHALVGTPDHANLWLLARSPQVSEAIVQEYLAEAERQGFDLDSWISPRQSGRVVSDAEVE